MALSKKRKADHDDFIYTISDNEDTELPDEDDGAMDPDFEWDIEAAAGDDFDGWGFEGPKNALIPKKGADIDEIVRRRREKKESTPNGATINKDAESEEDNGDELDLDDDDDEVLADDAFGMGADLGDEEAAENGTREGEASEGDADGGDHDDDDDESVASPVAHPDDADSQSSSDDDDEEDEEEAAKRKDFFAADEPTEDKKGGATFQGMHLSRPILRGLNKVGFTRPTPIQAKTIPMALMGKDVVGGAVTGSGKTGAFLVPILERLLYRPTKVATSRVVVLLPTRELAIQCHSVATKLAAFTDIKFCLAVGGLSLKAQEVELRLRPDIIIATPGRFIDHMRNSVGFASDKVEILVLDEADRMLEDGFADELNEILTTLPKSRQTMLFSATMTSSVDDLIRVGLNKPVRLMVDPSRGRTVNTLIQEFVRLRPGREEKRMGYLVHLCKTLYTERVIIFFRQKTTAHEARITFALLGLSCAELHGSLNQTQRITSVEEFRQGKVAFLLATDLASRGLDIKGVDTVINYEAPQNLEVYVHRVGRTARAGRGGVAITLAAEPDRKVVKAAVKAGRKQGSKIISRVIDAAEADKWQAKIDDLADEIQAVIAEEKEEKAMAQVDMQVRKGENMIRHEDEIKSRPKRTWFESEREKRASRQHTKETSEASLEKSRERLKRKHGGKFLSNKDKKKLDLKAERLAALDGSGARMYKKGAAERAGKGAVLNFKKDKKPARKSGAVVSGRVSKKSRGKPISKGGRR